jgi:hypothetical protein
VRSRALTPLLVIAACRFDPSYRDTASALVPVCTEGVVECRGNALVRCVSGTPLPIDDCGARGQACAPTFLECRPCLPEELTCSGFDVQKCDSEGRMRTTVETCAAADGFACRSGRCVQLCEEAARRRSNVGCEYWAVDLDNAVVSNGNAAAQQFAVIVSNPEPDLAARVTIEEDLASVGAPNATRVVASASVGVRRLEVFKLGPKEVDGSPPGAPNGGTGTALTRGAFRIRATVPIVAYQFNPLDNVNVFSNDASLLLPTAALNRGGRAYLIAGWPQTLARTDFSETNANIDLRAFLTIVGTTPNTQVRVTSKARVIPGGPFASGIAAGATASSTLQPFDVLNLETGDLNADFTGSIVEADQPVAVFVGSEASDAPAFDVLSERSCCADHLESQVPPVRSVGRRYAIGRMPNRSRAIAAAGGALASFEEPELYRVVAVAAGPTVVKTSLPAPFDRFTLDGEGKDRTIVAGRDFTLDADKPVLIADVQVSQEAAGVARGLPGGDPSMLFVPPIEQWRSDYILLTPDKYAFDYLVITAPESAKVFLDGLPVDGKVCDTAAIAPYTVYRCQLSFPIIASGTVTPGRQNDGVHRVQSDLPLGVLVYGFDSFVSYAYAGGTELVDVNAN